MNPAFNVVEVPLCFRFSRANTGFPFWIPSEGTISRCRSHGHFSGLSLVGQQHLIQLTTWNNFISPLLGHPTSLTELLWVSFTGSSSFWLPDARVPQDTQPTALLSSLSEEFLESCGFKYYLHDVDFHIHISSKCLSQTDSLSQPLPWNSTHMTKRFLLPTLHPLLCTCAQCHDYTHPSRCFSCKPSFCQWSSTWAAQSSSGDFLKVSVPRHSDLIGDQV